MDSRDYSDSEDELDSRDPIDSIDHDQGNEGIERVQPSAGKPTSSGLRIKFRHPKAPSHERSSLSPPPPLTLKFGLPPSAATSSKSAKAERAAYSSSEDDEPGPSEPVAKTATAKPKKPRASRAKKRPLETPTAALELPVGQAAGRKSYDWLIPSFAGASHQGPTSREKEEPARKIQKLSESNEFDDLHVAPGLSPIIPDGQPKRSHKKKKDNDVPGPGKAWRKGLKKGVIRIPREAGTDTPAASTPGNSRPGSLEGTPEEEEGRSTEIPTHIMATPDGPFVLADPNELGIPIFSRPIAAPKMFLSNFPKVTPYFLPNNGGDTGPFPRREKTRSWKDADRTFVGIGGGTLRFKSWIKGSPGDLTHVLKAEKDVQDIKARANKELADAKPKEGKEKDGVEPKPKASKANEARSRAPKEKDENKTKSSKEDKVKQPRTIAIAPRPSSVTSSRQNKEASGELDTTPVRELPGHDHDFSAYRQQEIAARHEYTSRYALEQEALQARRDDQMRQLRATVVADQAMTASASRQRQSQSRDASGEPTSMRDHLAEGDDQEHGTFISYDHNAPKPTKRSKAPATSARPAKANELFATNPLPEFSTRGDDGEGPVLPSVFQPASATSYAPELFTSFETSETSEPAVPAVQRKSQAEPSPVFTTKPLYGDGDVGELPKDKGKTPRRSKLAQEIRPELPVDDSSPATKRRHHTS